MSPGGARWFRGVSMKRAVSSMASLATIYVGAYAVLVTLGLVIRGWRGWALLVVPLVLLVVGRLLTWRRVGVTIDGERLRYEGSERSRDFEVELTRIEGVYFDPALPGRPLVLVTDDRDENVCVELSERAAKALHRELVERGVLDLDRGPSSVSPRAAAR